MERLLWIQQIDNILEAVAIFCEQITQLLFEINFFLKPCIAFQSKRTVKSPTQSLR